MLTWSGDQIAIDGVLGPPLTGPKGDKGDTGPTGPSGASARIYGYTRTVYGEDYWGLDVVEVSAFCYTPDDEILESSYTHNGFTSYVTYWYPHNHLFSGEKYSYASVGVHTQDLWLLTVTVTVKCIGLR
jgi:hypothetical protein